MVSTSLSMVGLGSFQQIKGNVGEKIDEPEHSGVEVWQGMYGNGGHFEYLAGDAKL